MYEYEKTIRTEPVPIADTVITNLISVERLGDTYRLTFGVERECLHNAAHRELVVVARLVVPCSHYVSVVMAVRSAIMAQEPDSPLKEISLQ